MIKLIIARHAESEWNVIGRYQGLKDPDLTERGLRQAELLAHEMKEEDIDFVITSPLKRTYKTAQIVADHLGLELVKEDRIIEIDHGIWSGMLVEEVRKKYTKDFEVWINEPHKVKFPEGESLREVFERVRAFIADIKDRFQNKKVFIVSHTVPIRCMYCVLLNIDLSKFWNFGCDNASYSVVHIDSDRAVINKLNITCHLGELYVESHQAL